MAQLDLESSPSGLTFLFTLKLGLGPLDKVREDGGLVKMSLGLDRSGYIAIC